jgi:Zn-dependent protease
MNWLFYLSLESFLLSFPIALLTVGFGFIGHELAHKFAAQRLGCVAEFRLWFLGLVTALLFAFITRGSIIFAAPGAVYIQPKNSPFGINRRDNGYISLAGPVTNTLLAMVFFLLIGSWGVLDIIGRIGFQVNLWLAAFNLLPFGVLDGEKIFQWSRVVWVAITAPIWILVIARYIGLI